jgi:rRNA large subunit m3Psi methyltransferase RlmH
MNIRIVCVGKIKEKYFTQGILEYLKRLSRYAKVEIMEVGDEKAPENLSPAEEALVKEREAAKLSKYFQGRCSQDCPCNRRQDPDIRRVCRLSMDSACQGEAKSILS